MQGYAKVAIALVLGLGLIRLYSLYKVQAAPILPGVMIGHHDLRRVRTEAGIVQTLRERSEKPVLAEFNGRRVIVEPEAVGFRVDVDRILAEAETYLGGDPFLRTVLRQTLGLPEERYQVPIYYWFDRPRARILLSEINAAHRTLPQAYALQPVDRDWWSAQLGEDVSLAEAGFMAFPYPHWTWQPGRPGVQVDFDASLEAMARAFIGPGERRWALSVREEPGPGPELAQLGAALDDFTANFLGFASFYLQDLTTGEETAFDSAVAFSGMSNLKLLIAMATMQDIDGIASDTDIGQWLDLALGDSNNAAANILLFALGDGDVRRGAAAVTAFGRAVGLENTFLLTGYDDAAPVTPLVTPANTQTEWNTRPDSHLQTTAADMGRVLAGIYACAQGGGIFIETFPADITPDECRAVLFYLTHNDFQEMLWGGLPQRTTRTVWHKHGFSDEQHGDVALVWGPAGPYVISLFLYRPGWLDWAVSNSTMYNASRIAWRFFEETAHREGRAFAPPLALAPPEGYVPQPGAE